MRMKARARRRRWVFYASIAVTSSIELAASSARAGDRFAGALDLDPASILTVTLRAIGEDSEPIQLTASVHARVELAPGSGLEPTFLDVDSDLLPIADVMLTPSFGTGTSLTGSAVGMSIAFDCQSVPMSPSGAGFATFDIDASCIRIHSGSLTVSGTVFSSPLEESFDVLLPTPLSGGEGAGSIQLVEGPNGLLDAVITLPVDSSVVVTMDPANVWLDFAGTLSFSGALAPEPDVPGLSAIAAVALAVLLAGFAVSILRHRRVI